MKKNSKTIFCDNTVEDKTLKEKCAKSSEEINFSFLSPGTPQKNCVIEWGFDTIYSRMHEMIVHARLHET